MVEKYSWEDIPEKERVEDKLYREVSIGQVEIAGSMRALFENFCSLSNPRADGATRERDRRTLEKEVGGRHSGGSESAAQQV